MGYRLEISKIEYKESGGKLFGYVEDETKLESWKWLKNHEFITGDEYWDYGCNPQIVLDDDEFKEFIELYIFDLHNYYKYEIDSDWIKSLRDLAKTKEDKLLEWW